MSSQHHDLGQLILGVRTCCSRRSFILLNTPHSDLVSRRSVSDADVQPTGSKLVSLVYSVVVGRVLIKAAAWKLERGTTLGILEQLMGSQTIGGTLIAHYRLLAYSDLHSSYCGRYHRSVAKSSYEFYRRPRHFRHHAQTQFT